MMLSSNMNSKALASRSNAGDGAMIIDINQIPGAKAINFYEEEQIAEIYGMTEDYTPPSRTKTAYQIYSEHVRIGYL